MRYLPLFLLFSCLALITSCKKEIACDSTDNIDFSLHGNTQYKLGDSIHLSAAYIPKVQYYWKGPDNFRYIKRDTVLYLDRSLHAGTYSVSYQSLDGCVDKKDQSLTLQIDTVIPCNPKITTITYNGIESNITGGDYSEYSKDLVLTCNDMELTFSFPAQSNRLYNGVYHTAEKGKLDLNTNDTKVKLYLNSSGKEYYAKPGAKVYVYVDFLHDIITVSFCHLEFNGLPASGKAMRYF